MLANCLSISQIWKSFTDTKEFWLKLLVCYLRKKLTFIKDKDTKAIKSDYTIVLSIKDQVKDGL